MATIYNMALFTCGEISIEMKMLLIVVFCYFMLLADSFSMIMSFNSIILYTYYMATISTLSTVINIQHPHSSTV